MIINLDMFFPCSKTWLTRLIKTVIRRSTDPEGHIEHIRKYLLEVQWDLQEGTREYGPRDIQRIQDCLDMIGGTDGQRSNTAAG